MISKENTSFLVLVIFLFTIIQLPISYPQEVAPIQLGYAPSGLFDVTVGTLSFMKGEDIWLRSDSHSLVILIDPEGNRKESRLVEAGIPTFLHHFTELDKLGNWEVRVSSSFRISAIEVELTSSEVQVLASLPQFSLESETIVIKGTLELARKGIYDGGFLFLVKSSPVPDTVVRNIPLVEIGGSLELTITQNPVNPLNVAVSPHLIVPVETAETEDALPPPSIETVIWAEIIGEVPLVKSGSTPVITYAQRTVLETPKLPITLETTANETFNIQLPKYGEVGSGGSIPMRPMSTRLVVYLQLEDTIHIVSIPRFEIDQMLGKVIVDQLEVPPLMGTFDYTFRDAIDDIAAYELIYLPNVNGIERVWTTQLRPEVAKVRVFNSLTSSDLIDYELDLEGGKDSVIFDGITYVLLPDRSVVLSAFDLIVQGQVLDMSHVSPDLVRLESARDSTITVSLGRVSFDVIDGVGNEVDSGTITMTQEGQSPIVVEWSGALFPASIMLPSGAYDAKVEASGEIEGFSFIVNKGENNIDVTMQSITYIPRELYLLLASFAIIIVEVVIIYRLWGRVLRRVTPRTK